MPMCVYTKGLNDLLSVMCMTKACTKFDSVHSIYVHPGEDLKYFKVTFPCGPKPLKIQANQWLHWRSDASFEVGKVIALFCPIMEVVYEVLYTVHSYMELGSYQVATLVKASVPEGDNGLRSGSQRRLFYL